MKIGTLPLMTATLLLGAALRLIGLTTLGLEHDEVANWLIDRSILAGNHSIYFEQAYGHEAGFHYLQTLSVALLGDHALALRLPAALLGILLIAVAYRLGRQLYSRFIGVINALIVAVTFFPIFYSRLALRAMLLPLLAGLSAIIFWQALQQAAGRRRTLLFALAGLLAGLSLHSYMAARVVPIFYLLFGLYLAVWRRPLPWRQLLLFGGCLLAVALPLFVYLMANPGAEFRISEIDEPLRRLRQGDLGPVLRNSWRIAAVWGWHGDPLWRQNVAGQPIFEPLTALLFYAGVLLLLLRRRAADLFVLLWIATATIPSVVTADAPSTIRMINMLPLLGVPVAIVIHRLSTLSTKPTGLSTTLATMSWITILTAAIIWGSGRSARFVYTVWPNGGDCLAGDCVPFVWQTALTAAARFLDESERLPTSIVGWSPTTMDPPTLTLALRRDDLPLRFSNGETLVLPFGSGATVQIVQPLQPELPLAAALADWLAASGAATTRQPAFALYRLAEPVQQAVTERFGDELALLSVTACRTQSTTCELLTIWRVLQTPSAERAVFVHVLDADGAIVSQSDGLDVPTDYWQAGDLIVRRHLLQLDRATALRIGVYDPASGVRLTTAAGGDSIVVDRPAQ